MDAYVHGLTRAGVPNVRVDYQEPRPEEIERTGAERERPGFGLRRLLELVRSAGPGGRGRRARRAAVIAELMADPREGPVPPCPFHQRAGKGHNA